MVIRLYHRTNGYHTLVKETKIPFTFRKYVKGCIPTEHRIIEDLLIENIPDNFLPVESSKILLTVMDKSKTGATGQRGLSRFKNWSKYFPGYCLDLTRD